MINVAETTAFYCETIAAAGRPLSVAEITKAQPSHFPYPIASFLDRAYKQKYLTKKLLTPRKTQYWLAKQGRHLLANREKYKVIPYAPRSKSIAAKAKPQVEAHDAPYRHPDLVNLVNQTAASVRAIQQRDMQMLQLLGLVAAQYGMKLVPMDDNDKET